MSFELKYTKDETLFSRIIEPAGQFSIITSRQNHRYYEEFSGTMTISKDDFTWVMEAGPCTEIYITCQFHRLWKGVFSHADCTTINRSKRFLEVQPRSDDEYSKIEPWMGLEMNIIPPFNGIDSKVSVLSLNQYEIQTRIIRITEPYEGPNAENWNGYSVNDWIGTGGTIPEAPYRGDRQVNNSLIYKITGGAVPFGTTTTIDAWNRLVWLDALGYDLKIAEMEINSFNFVNRYWRESMFTLSEVINFYKEDGSWEYCDLVYKRELFDSNRDNPPPSGRNFSADLINSDSPGASANISSGRWIYNVAERKWIRRYLGLHERGTNSNSSETDSAKTGDGFDFTPLTESRKDGRRVMMQVLFRNKYEEQDSGVNWYRAFYDFVYYADHFHQIKPLLEKFISFTKTKGATTSLTKEDLESKFLFESNNPYTGKENIWPNVLIGQNSDIKRPLSSERATREMMSFSDFIDLLCSVTNTAWAVIDGKFVIEHISYFHRGLTYEIFNPNVPVLNPYSIVNIAKNKGFMSLTDIYRYEKRLMPKYEIFKTVGGQEPQNNNLTIEYSGGCINNKPNENISEIEINTTFDYDYSRSEGRDEGLSFILIEKATLPPPFNIEINLFVPTKDEFGRYVYNSLLTLEYVVRNYYDWGRVLSEAKLNDAYWGNLTPFYNITQNISFPYKVQSPSKAENPYTSILTGIGFGIINRTDYTTKEGWVDYELRFNAVESLLPSSSKLDWHIHTQISDNSLWEVNHSMDTYFMMRPVVFDVEGNEIEYNSFRVKDKRTLEIKFSEPVSGNAHFIALNVAPEKIKVNNWLNASSVTIDHQLDRMPDQIALSCVFDTEGYEVRPLSVGYPSDFSIDIDFSHPVSGSVAVADITGGYVTPYSGMLSSQDSIGLARTENRVYNKPLVLESGKEILYNSHQLIAALRIVGFSEQVIAGIVIMEKNME